jgi:hypothetical protein
VRRLQHLQLEEYVGPEFAAEMLRAYKRSRRQVRADALPSAFDLAFCDQHLLSTKQRAAARPPAQIRIFQAGVTGWPLTSL